jgi:hypothetical protein
VLTSLGSVLIYAVGHGSDEVATVYTSARDLCHSLGKTSDLAPVLQGVRLHHKHLSSEERELSIASSSAANPSSLRPILPSASARNETEQRRNRRSPVLAKARKAAEELLALGQQVQDTGHLLEGHRAVGVVHFYAGEFRASREHLEKESASMMQKSIAPMLFDMYTTQAKPAWRMWRGPFGCSATLTKRSSVASKLSQWLRPPLTPLRSLKRWLGGPSSPCSGRSFRTLESGLQLR